MLGHLIVVEDPDELTGVHDVGVDVVLVDHDRRPLERHAATFPTTSAGMHDLAGDRGRRGDPGVGEVHERLVRAHPALEVPVGGRDRGLTCRR